jgi:O-methyltransferase
MDIDLSGKTRDELDELRADLKPQGFALIQLDDSAVHSYPYDSPWLEDEDFTRVYRSISANTLVDRARCYSLYLLAQQSRKVAGDILEVGSWRGGTGALLAQVLPDRSVFLADTFAGVVKSADWEHYVDATHSDTSEQLVADFVSGLGLTNVELLTGIFPEETGSRVSDRSWAMVYLDLDVYQSTKDAFEFVWDDVVVGGFVAFDDYGMTSACAGISKFVHEVKDDADKLFIQNLNGQAYLVKLP